MFQCAFEANARADPKLPSYHPLHFFNGAVKRANCGRNDGGDNDGDDVRLLNPQGEADFLFHGLSPLRGDEKLEEPFSLEVD